MTTVKLAGEITFNTMQMECETMATSTKSLENIKAECQVVDPTTFEWLQLTAILGLCVSMKRKRSVTIFQLLNQRIVIIILHV